MQTVQMFASALQRSVFGRSTHRAPTYAEGSPQIREHRPESFQAKAKKRRWWNWSCLTAEAEAKQVLIALTGFLGRSPQPAAPDQSATQAIFCRRGHQPRRPPLAVRGA